MDSTALRTREGISCPKCSHFSSSLLELESHVQQAHRQLAPHDSKVRVAPEPLRPEQPHTGGVYGIGRIPSAVPEPDPTFWLDEEVERFLNAVGARTSLGGIANVLLLGPTGTGKSSLPREFAAKWKRPFLTMHCQMVTEQEDWWGSKEVSPELGTYFRQAALVDALESPGWVILLDEVNRTHPENLNALFGFLDHRRRAWVPALQREVVVAPGTMFFVTINEGIDYVGTSAIDRALRDRMSSTIRMDYLPTAVEEDLIIKRTGLDARTAQRLVQSAHTLRNNPKLDEMVSTRQLLECAELIRDGLSLEEAAMFSIVNGVPDGVSRKALLQSLQIAGGLDEVYLEKHWDEEEE